MWFNMLQLPRTGCTGARRMGTEKIKSGEAGEDVAVMKVQFVEDKSNKNGSKVSRENTRARKDCVSVDSD